MVVEEEEEVKVSYCAELSFAGKSVHRTGEKGEKSLISLEKEGWKVELYPRRRRNIFFIGGI